jgi:hypothetical protein
MRPGIYSSSKYANQAEQLFQKGQIFKAAAKGFGKLTICRRIPRVTQSALSALDDRAVVLNRRQPIFSHLFLATCPAAYLISAIDSPNAFHLETLQF